MPHLDKLVTVASRRETKDRKQEKERHEQLHCRSFFVDDVIREVNSSGNEKCERWRQRPPTVALEVQSRSLQGGKNETRKKLAPAASF
jgi:hypothetical protein